MRPWCLKIATGTALVAFAAGVLTSCEMVRPPPAPAPLPPPAAPRFSFLRADGTRTVDEDGRQVVLKGCNLGNWLLIETWMLEQRDIRDQWSFESILRERFGEDGAARLMETYRENWIAERDFDIVRSFGFNVVRVPFHYSLLEDDEHPGVLKPDAFHWLDRAVDMAGRRGLYVILDLHGTPGGQSRDHTTGREGQNRLWEDRAAQDRTVWLWREIAAHFKDAPVVAALEPMNEPFGDYETAAHLDGLSALMGRIYDAIREVDERHLVIIPGAREGLQFYGRPADRGWKNVMFTEHYYPGTMWGEPGLAAHRHHINRLLPGVEKYLAHVDAPFLVGEFNVVFRRSGGPMLMRQYYDLYGERGWWATMWCYKTISRRGGVGRDNWYMVTNLDPAPEVDLRTSSREDIEAFFQWLGTMEYGVYEDLREALTAEEPPRLSLDDPRHPMEPPYADDPAPWQGTNIACRPAGGQRVHSPARMDVYGGGRDIWNDHDEFRFVWQKPEGAFAFEATLEDLTDVNPYTKAGIMIRGGLEADAPHVLLHVFPNHHIVISWRPVAGANMQEHKFVVAERPVRFRLVRTGDRVDAFFAVGDGPWREAGGFTFDWLAGGCYAGLAVLSHDERYLARASFNNIRLSKE